MPKFVNIMVPIHLHNFLPEDFYLINECEKILLIDKSLGKVVMQHCGELIKTSNIRWVGNHQQKRKMSLYSPHLSILAFVLLLFCYYCHLPNIAHLFKILSHKGVKSFLSIMKCQLTVKKLSIYWHLQLWKCSRPFH